MVISYVNCVCLLTFAVWPELWLARTGGLAALHVVDTLARKLKLKWAQMGVVLGLSMEQVPWQDSEG